METYSLNSSIVESLYFENDKNVTIFQLSTLHQSFQSKKLSISRKEDKRQKIFFDNLWIYTIIFRMVPLALENIIR